MDFPCAVTVLVLSSSFTCFTVNTVAVVEDCFRSDEVQSLEFDSPCADESGQPDKLEYCSKGRKSKGYCSTECEYCDPDGTTYQSGFTNCTSCLPCKTLADCPPGQVIIKNCTAETNAVCGCPRCPDQPPCPTCESHQTVPPSLTSPLHPECPACDCPKSSSDDQVPDSLKSFQSCWSLWIVVPVLLITAISLIVNAILGSYLWKLKRSQEEGKRHDSGAKKDEENNKPTNSASCSTSKQDEAGTSKNAPMAELEDLDENVTNSGTRAEVKSKDVNRDKQGATSYDDPDNSETPLLGKNTNDDFKMDKLSGDLEKKNKENDSQTQREEKAKIQEIERKAKEQKDKFVKELQEKENHINEMKAQLAKKDENFKKGWTELQQEQKNKIQESERREKGQKEKLDNMEKELKENQERIKGLEEQLAEATATKVKNEMKSIPAPFVQSTTEPDGNLEADRASEDQAMQSTRENEDSPEDTTSESSKFAPGGVQMPSFPVQGSASKSGRIKQLKTERQESVSSRNNMELTFTYLSENLGRGWQRVGRILRISDAKLSSLKIDADEEGAIYDMFLYWRQSNGSGATYDLLIKALEKAGRKDLADDLRSSKDLEKYSRDIATKNVKG